jgi:hypothetical protein
MRSNYFTANIDDKEESKEKFLIRCGHFSGGM